MANEINLKYTVVYAGKEANAGALGFTIGERSINIDQSGKDVTHFTQSIGTSAAEALTASNEIGTQGVVLIRNLNTTDGQNVLIGLSGQTASQMAVKIKPGEEWPFRANAALYALAKTSAVSIEGWIFED